MKDNELKEKMTLILLLEEKIENDKEELAKLKDELGKYEEKIDSDN